MADMLVGERSDWYARARCREIDPDVFFPVADDEAGIARAKLVCAQCPVVGPCLEQALANREPGGVWGGCDERDRRRILKTRR